MHVIFYGNTMEIMKSNAVIYMLDHKVKKAEGVGAVYQI